MPTDYALGSDGRYEAVVAASVGIIDDFLIEARESFTVGIRLSPADERLKLTVAAVRSACGGCCCLLVSFWR